MRELDARIISEINDLTDSGMRLNQMVSTASSDIEGEQMAAVAQWITRLGQLIRRLYGEKSQYFESYMKPQREKDMHRLHSNYHQHFSQLVGVADAIKHDVTNGLLFDVKSMAQAEVFADFLEMGEHLLNEGYKDAAAVIIGGVLEDSLRKLCDRNEIATTNESGKSLTIDPLNIALAKAEVYSKLDQKQITTWADVRNNAAHGKYDQYSKEEVKMMLLFVQDFTGKHLA